MDPVRFPNIILDGHKLTLDSSGIEINAYTAAPTIVGGIVTSSESFLKVRSLGTGHTAPGNLYIRSVITDSTHKVGVQLSGEYGALVFEGDKSNTFTGNVEILGASNSLHLNKVNGSVAVRSDIPIEQGGLLFRRGNQLSKTSSVTLRNNGNLAYGSLSNYSITNTFKNLVIENGGGIHFYHSDIKDSLNSKYYIYLDDLIISDAGLLIVTGWQDGRDFLLVRKSSQHLADALTKMAFVGYNPANIHLRDFNRDYWQISALPEPTTYGAIVATGGLVLAAWQRRRKRPPRG